MTVPTSSSASAPVGVGAGAGASASGSVTLNDEVATSPGPFEGPEKLLEVWFAPSADELPRGSGSNGSTSGSALPKREGLKGRAGGLRVVPRAVWEEMLDIVKCKVLSVVEGEDLDAYLLSESSLFVAPHVIILKTCGTTLNLLGLHRIIEIAREYCGFTNVWRCFYSRKSFFFPERQSGPHRDWRDEVNFLDSVFGTAGSAYTVGPMNRDHWLLYLTSPNAQPLLPSDASLSSSFHLSLPAASPPLPSPFPSHPHSHKARITYHDTTLEILMSHLSPAGREPFFQPDASTASGHALGATISRQMGIDALFSPSETVLDSFGFDPCGYSANAVVGAGLPGREGNGGGYFTIHVTPEDGWSYASFECNVPLPPPGASAAENPEGRPDLPTLIRRVVDIFQPNRLSITLFVSTPSGVGAAIDIDSDSGAGQGTGTDEHAATAEVESQAWRAFRGDLLGREFERKDRIGYEFEGYDLIFACFERRGWVEPRGTLGKVEGLAEAEQAARALERLEMADQAR